MVVTDASAATEIQERIASVPAAYRTFSERSRYPSAHEKARRTTFHHGFASNRGAGRLGGRMLRIVVDCDPQTYILIPASKADIKSSSTANLY